MSEQSSVHFYLNWAKERIDEMDAALASFGVKAGEAKAESQVKAQQIITELTKRRDEFRAQFKTQAEAGEAAWAHSRTELEKQWNGFEAQMKTYFESAGKQIEQQQTTFKDIAAAQAKAWREAADKFREAAGKVAAAHAGDFEAALKQMKSDASEAEARLQTLKQAGSESWSVLSAALAEARKSFDQANQAAWNALKGSGSKS
ncbi:hypothetical protein [Bradyrhizobium sp. BR 10289]|uniref:hypothetical protein n=1 Tax=Bradyrhizobium sp. BR 10289 TaxID=2749993 RepID=UPI001C646D19|nr:hypothetical protein [Bradyrhizobium sp. BR 10289]MBW7970569.1 hypothetical protein [Bradyrhizobium sp. BR 10289]